MAARSISDDVAELLDEATFGRHADLRRFTPRVKQAFRVTFPAMTKLLDTVEAFRFNTRHGTRHLLRWPTKRGGYSGWVCNRRRITWHVPKQVIQEHRLVHDVIGEIESRVGIVPELPMGAVRLFSIPQGAGLGETPTESYVEQSAWLGSDSIPDPDSFVIFGAEGNGDLWVYTPDDERVYQIVFSSGPIDSTGLRQVKATPILYYVKAARTFNEFVEFFAQRHLRILKQ